MGLRRQLTVGFTAISLVVSAMPGNAMAAPLAELVPDLLEEHPQVQAAEQSVESREHGKKEAFSGYLPKVDLLGATGYEDFDRTGTTPPGGDTNQSTHSYGVTLTQPLFRGFRTEAGYETADTNQLIAEYTLALTRQQVLYEGTSSYLNVLRQIELTRLADENRGKLQNQLRLEDERVQRGSGIAVDVLQAKSRLQISIERVTAFRGALQDAISRFTQVFGHPPELESMTVPDLPLEMVPESLDAAIDTALKMNPGLEGNELNVDVASLARKTAKSGYFPNLDLVANANYDDNLSGTVGEEERMAILLRATWNIFNGFADKARVQRAASDYQAAQDTYDQARRKTAEEVKLAWSSMVTSRERMELLENAVNIAGEVYDTRVRLRDVGTESSLNVLDAENELYRARIDWASAKYDYYTSIYRLLLAMGVLTPDVII